MYDKNYKNSMNYNRQKICSRERRLETLVDTEKRGSRIQLFADFSNILIPERRFRER